MSHDDKSGDRVVPIKRRTSTTSTISNYFIELIMYSNRVVKPCTVMVDGYSGALQTRPCVAEERFPIYRTGKDFFDDRSTQS